MADYPLLVEWVGKFDPVLQVLFTGPREGIVTQKGDSNFRIGNHSNTWTPNTDPRWKPVIPPELLFMEKLKGRR